MLRPLVSVIIPIRHGEDIQKTLKAIRTSSYKSIETIVVDEGLERSAQRNIGITLAKGEYLLVLDSDQVISKYLIEECAYKLLYLPYLAGIYIPEVIPGESFFNRVRNFERQFYTATAVDVVRFVRREGCPLFDKSMSGPEDSDWDRRVGGMRIVSKSCLYHYDNIGLLDYMKKKAYYSKSMKRYHEKHPDDKVLRLTYRCFWIFVENDKWLRLLRHPILSMGILFIIIVRGFIWLKSR
jgi:glycosyltransferase involved in cell wall biosynthesis